MRDERVRRAMNLAVDLVGVYVPAVDGAAAGRLVTLAGGAQRAIDTRNRGYGLGAKGTEVVDLASGDIILDATAGSDAGIDIVSSEYAVIAAEQTALENLSHEVAEQIVTRVATKLRKTD